MPSRNKYDYGSQFPGLQEGDVVQITSKNSIKRGQLGWVIKFNEIKVTIGFADDDYNKTHPKKIPYHEQSFMRAFQLSEDALALKKTRQYRFWVNPRQVDREDAADRQDSLREAREARETAQRNSCRVASLEKELVETHTQFRTMQLKLEALTARLNEAVNPPRKRRGGGDRDETAMMVASSVIPP